jgi:hypothetical protein
MYGNLTFKEERARLDNLATQLKTEPRSKGYIFVYDSSRGNIKKLRLKACRALQYLVNSRGVDPKRIVVLAGIVNDEPEGRFTVELWMFPVDFSDELPLFGHEIDGNETIIIKGIEARTKCCRKQ